MKKIMFNDRYGLTDAVLTGRKTMTRRIVKEPRRFKGCEDTSLEFHQRLGSDIWYDCVVCDADGHELGQLPLPFEVGDVVAVAQSYKSIYDAMEESDGNSKANEWWCELYDLRIGDGLGPAVTPGYSNKMFVRANLMPHRIRITDLWFERLQDISDEDCLKEGLLVGEIEPKIYGFKVGKHVNSYMSPREAFAALIDRISGRGTWKSNPWVVAYEFELINKEDLIMSILNIELSEYDALRDRVKQLECENRNLSEAIEDKAEDGRLRVIKKTVTITRNPWKAFNEHALDSYTEKYEFLNFDDIEQEAKSQFYKDMANRIQSQEQQEISELKEQLKRSQEHLDSSLGRIDRLMKRNWWDRLWNKGVK